MQPLTRALSFMLPGKARGFRVRELAAAKTWLAAGVETETENGQLTSRAA